MYSISVALSWASVIVLSPPRHPQTNGMVERFNGRISGVVQQTRFASASELESTLTMYPMVCDNRLVRLGVELPEVESASFMTSPVRSSL